MSIFFEPYVMSFIIALVVSVVYYFYKRNNLKEEDEENIHVRILCRRCEAREHSARVRWLREAL